MCGVFINTMVLKRSSEKRPIRARSLEHDLKLDAAADERRSITYELGGTI